MLIIISATFFLLSISGMLVLVYRHIGELQTLNPENLPEVKDTQRKNTILEKRLKRKLLVGSVFVWKKLRPVLVWLKDFVRNSYHYLLEKERVLREASEKFKFHQKTRREQDVVISDKLEEVVTVKSSGEEDLEKKYLEILALDPKNTEAYEGLAELYMKQKDYVHAREIYEFIIKTVGEKTDYLLGLATCWQEDKKFENAFKTLENALALEPKSPKIIDMLVEIAIIMRDSSQAKNYLIQLKEVNPDNKKIAEFKIQINQI